MDDSLLEYQNRWNADPAVVKVCEKSRRVGISWGDASESVLRAAQDPGGRSQYYISYNKDMTRQYIDDCAFWTQSYNCIASEIQEEIIRDEGRDVHAFRIDYASKHHIMALSGSPRNIRSKQGDVFIDEAAFVDNMREILKAAIALTMWGGRVRIVSTHNGEENPFHELVEDCRKGRLPYSLHRITLDDALAQGLYRRICVKSGQAWSPEAEARWRQGLIDFYADSADEELFCIPSKSGGRYLPLMLIESCMRPEIPILRFSCDDEFALQPARIREMTAQDFCNDQLRGLLAELPELPSFVGEDFGRNGDLTVVWPIQRQANMKYRTPCVLEMRNVPFEQQRQVLHYLCDRLPRFRGACLDARGNGQYLAEVTAQRYGASRVEQVMITRQWYLDNMPRMKAAMEDQSAELPKHSDYLDDFRAVIVDKGVACIPDVRTEGRDGTGKRHGDAAIGLCMAIRAARNFDSGTGTVLSGGPRVSRSILRGY